MKSLRYIVVALLVLVSSSALAWTAEVNKAVLMLAEENLSGKAKKEVGALLGASLPSVEFVNKGESSYRLDENGKSVTTDEKDAVVRLEKAIATLQDKSASTSERQKALREAVELTVDIHCLGNLSIDKHLDKEFTFSRHNAMQVNFRYYIVRKRSWKDLWHESFHDALGAFSSDMYLYDWHIATKGKAKAYKGEAVAPRKWAEQTGERAFAMLKIIQPDALIESVEVSKLDEVNNSCIYDAVFRLANLLNKTLK